MAWPFRQTKICCGLPASTSLAFWMTTLATHATACSLRVTLYADAARTQAVGSATAVSSAGNVRERLVCTISGLTPDSEYFPRLEYEEVAGSGTWVESAAATSGCGYITSPTLAGVLRTLWYSDAHLTEARIDPNAQVGSTAWGFRERHRNFLASTAKQRFHLAWGGSDLPFDGSYDVLNLGILEFERTLRDKCPVATDWGNWEFIQDQDGPFPPGMAPPEGWEAYFAEAEASYLAHNLNSPAASARENYGKLVLGSTTILWAEVWSASGLLTGQGEEFNAQLEAAQMTFLLAEIAACATPNLVIKIHTALINTTVTASVYARAGGTRVIQAGTQSETLHNALLAKLPNLRFAAVIRGHDHRAEHTIQDGVHYLQVPSTTAPFNYTAQQLVDFGYWADTDGTLPAVTQFEAPIRGYVRVNLSAIGVEIEFVQTTTAEGSPPVTADDTVVHSFGVGTMPVANRPAGTLILDESAAHYASIADASVATEGAGASSIAALVGRNLALLGTEGVDYEWTTALGGPAVRILSPTGAVAFAAAVGDVTRSRRTILVILSLSENDSQSIWSSGKDTAGPPGGGAAYIWGHHTGHATPLIDCAHRDTANTWIGGDSVGFTANAFMPVIITWDIATPVLKFVLLDPVRGKLTFTRSPDPVSGVVFKDGQQESYASGAYSIGFPPQGSVGAIFVAGFQWDQVFDDTEIDAALADPWFATTALASSGAPSRTALGLGIGIGI